MASVKRLPNGKWKCRVSLGGRRDRIQIAKTFRTQTLAKAWGRDKESCYQSGEPIEDSNMSLSEYIKLWLELVAKKKVRARTHHNYYQHLNKHVINTPIGQKQLSSVKMPDVQRIYNTMEESGLSPRSIQYLHTLLKASLTYAVDANYIAKNPCKNPQIILPKKQEKEIIVLDQNEVFEFILASKEIPNGIILETALELGARVGEYLALKWQDFDFTNNVVKINRSVYYPPGGGLQVYPAKDRKRKAYDSFFWLTQRKLA